MDEPPLFHALPVCGQQGISAQRERRHGATPQAFFRHVDQPFGAASTGIQVADGGAVQLDSLLTDRPLTGERCHQLGLSVAGNAGDAENFTGIERERNIVQGNAERAFGINAQVLDGQHRPPFARVRRRLADRQIAADHHARQRCRCFCARDYGAGDASVAQNRCLVAQRLDFVQLVTDVKDGDAFGGDLAQGFKQLFDSLGR